MKGRLNMLSPRACFAWIFSVSFVSVAWAHPSHLSLAEAEWNAQTGSLEVALKVLPLDLERALKRQFGRDVDLDKTPQKALDGMITRYLQQGFWLTDAEGRKRTWRWVGKEVSVKEAWLYFEADLPGGLQGVQIGSRFFMELQNDQVNWVNLRQGKRRLTLKLHARTPQKKVDLPASQQ